MFVERMTFAYFLKFANISAEMDTKVFQRCISEREAQVLRKWKLDITDVIG